MPKVYTNKDVLSAALERIEIAFNNFDNIFLSVSGGKDSSVMMQLTAKKARELGKRFSILFIDLEAQYKATIEHVNELLENCNDVLDEVYWVCLPISLRNAVSVIQPKWIPWNKSEKEKWVREMPEYDVKYPGVIIEDKLPEGWGWFQRGMEFEEFILYFAEWFNQRHGGITGTGVGIRSNESLNRFRTIISDKKERWKEYGWTTRLKFNSKEHDIYNFYPLYDWETEDIWGAVARLDLRYNYIYELMYKNGLSIHEQRLCQPYGDDQRNGLDQFRALEPETWEKVVSRVHGVNFGNIYCRTSLLGNIKSEKPEGMNWQQYTIFLLESLGLYAPELRDHYYRKIKRFFYWWDHKYNVPIEDVQDEAQSSIESKRKAPTWRRIARAIEKNDFWMTRLSFGQTKSDVKKLFELKKKYKNIIHGEDTDNKQLQDIAFELNMEDNYDKDL